MFEAVKDIAFRNNIQAFEAVLSEHPEAHFGDMKECPLEHVFGGGMYLRKIFIPKGMIIVGKIHRHAHPNFLMAGKVIVVTEDGGREYLQAPYSCISPAGTKRVLYTLEDTIWATVHKTDETDLEKIEQEVIAPSYNTLNNPGTVKGIGEDK